MLKLIKYMGPFKWAIVAIFILLFGQAMSDLSSPGLTSNIVNVGIQQGGVENAVPQVIRAAEFNKLTLFMTDADKARVAGDYILLDRSTLSAADYAIDVKTYPQLANAPLYKLNTNAKTEIATLDTIFSKSIPIVAA